MQEGRFEATCAGDSGAGAAISDHHAKFLDRYLRRIDGASQPSAIGDVVFELLRALDELRGALNAKSWELVMGACRRHPLHELLVAEEPYTRRAFLKPRGYAGDAEMLDYVYSGQTTTPLTARQSALFRALAWDSAAAQAVRARRDLLAKLVDETAARKARPRVLSMACGHLREADLAAAVQAGRVDYVAADQDRLSLSEVTRRLSPLGVRTANVSVRSLLANEVTFHDFDFVYAAGLYDYLGDEVARKLTRILCDALAPGGRLLLANFVPSHAGRAYMEAFMDWKLVYRTFAELRALADGIDERAVTDLRVFQVEPCVAYLELTKAEASPTP